MTCSSTCPKFARLDGPIRDLPMHASEMRGRTPYEGTGGRKIGGRRGADSFLARAPYRPSRAASVDTSSSVGEFLTAYNPYQPEIAQGTLQMLFEFRRPGRAALWLRRWPMPSLYEWFRPRAGTEGGDGDRVTRRKRAVLSGAPPLHPALCKRGQDHGQVHRRRNRRMRNPRSHLSLTWTD